MPELEPHLYIGRQNLAGPAIGGYAYITGGSYAVTHDVGLTPVVVGAFYAVCDLRLECISWSVAPAACGTTLLNFSYNATPVIAGATLLHGTADIAAVTYPSSYVMAPTAAVSGGADTFAVRNVPQGQWLVVAVTPDAAIDITRLSVAFSVWITGHVNSDSSYD